MTLTSGTELSSGLTNLINALLSIYFLFRLIQMDKEKKRKLLWVITFVVFIISSLVGAFIHGIQLKQETKKILWAFLNINLYLTIATYSICIWYEAYGLKITRILIPIYTILAIGIGLYNNFIAGSYTSFVVFTIINLFLLMIILIINIRKKHYLVYFLLAIIVFTIGSYLQTIYTLRLDLILVLDHNGIYHLMVMLFVILNYIGIKRSINNS